MTVRGSKFDNWIKNNRKSSLIKKMDDERLVYLIACGALDRERITNAIGDDAKLKKLVTC